MWDATMVVNNESWLVRNRCDPGISQKTRQIRVRIVGMKFGPVAYRIQVSIQILPDECQRRYPCANLLRLVCVCVCVCVCDCWRIFSVMQRQKYLPYEKRTVDCLEKCFHFNICVSESQDLML